jgi:hypothetical protein
MRLPRMTTRRWMLAVAIIAFVFYLLLDLYRFSKNPYKDDPRYIRLMRESAYRLNMAKEHAKRAALSAGKQADYHAAMAAKWKEAAYLLSRPVEPDPPSEP